MIPFWHAKETQSGSSVFFSFHFLEVLTAKGYTVYKDKGNDISTGKQKITECESVVFLCLQYHHVLILYKNTALFLLRRTFTES